MAQQSFSPSSLNHSQVHLNVDTTHQSVQRLWMLLTHLDAVLSANYWMSSAEILPVVVGWLGPCSLSLTSVAGHVQFSAGGKQMIHFMCNICAGFSLE